MPQLGPIIPRIRVRSFQESLSFYRDHLGFEPEVLWPAESPSFALLRNGAARLGLTTGDHLGPAGTELYIETTDVRAVHRRLAERGVSVEWGPEVYSYGRREFGVLDPAGHLVIFTEDAEEPPTTDEPVSASI